MIKKLCILGPAGFVAAYMFYRNIWISFIGMAVFIIYGLLDKKNVKKNRDRKMILELTDRLQTFLNQWLKRWIWKMPAHFQGV